MGLTILAKRMIIVSLMPPLLWCLDFACDHGSQVAGIISSGAVILFIGLLLFFVHSIRLEEESDAKRYRRTS
ncbi:hypothetical protein [Persicobacter psychrovividus]|uniref:Uncharacterized protein n=1 Tax=Persicobacter psychrovividus TaxID=387638 RepID=A0ABN6LAV0_9BACT|nr:hypothetical protein PEPS_26480 [Persicobacter psychrovividus]